MHIQDGSIEARALLQPGQGFLRHACGRGGHGPGLGLQGQDTSVGRVVVDNKKPFLGEFGPGALPDVLRAIRD